MFKLALGLCAIAMVQEASAASYTIRLTGSTAFRSATHKAIVSFLGGDASTGVPVRIAHTGTAQTASSAQGSSIATYVGTHSTDDYTIQVSFSGSVEGIRDVGALDTTMPYLPASAVPTLVSGLNGYGNAVLKVAADATDNQKAKFTFSDCLKQNTDYPGATLNTPDPVGVIPFCWVANKGSTLTNMSAQQARRLLTSGLVKKSLLTGVSTDLTKYVALTGRNKLSGTRVITLAETQHGVFSSVLQYKATLSGTVATSNAQITTLELWPASGTTNPNAGTGADLDPATGNGGYTSGGSIATAMGYQGTSVNITFWDPDLEASQTLVSGASVDLVGYVGISDALTSVTNTGKILTWNGSTYAGSANNDNIIYGNYTFWSMEQLYTRGTLDAGDTAFKSALLTFFTDQSSAGIGSSAITAVSMKVTRDGDGALVGTN